MAGQEEHCRGRREVEQKEQTTCVDSLWSSTSLAFSVGSNTFPRSSISLPWPSYFQSIVLFVASSLGFRG
jgi:hypothetical protein